MLMDGTGVLRAFAVGSRIIAKTFPAGKDSASAPSDRQGTGLVKIAQPPKKID
jgi:hypothetical protein